MQGRDQVDAGRLLAPRARVIVATSSSRSRPGPMMTGTRSSVRPPWSSASAAGSARDFQRRYTFASRTVMWSGRATPPPGGIPAVVATRGQCEAVVRSACRRSAGVSQPSVLRGRPLSSAATASRGCAPARPRSSSTAPDGALTTQGSALMNSVRRPWGRFLFGPFPWLRACLPDAPASAPPPVPARHWTVRAVDGSSMPPNQQTGLRNRPGNPLGLTPVAPSRPLYGPWSWGRPAEQSPGPRAATLSTYSAAGQRGWISPERCRTPNPRAADSVRSGEVDAPTGQTERFRRSETCESGAGGTRTHGRRIMSPLLASTARFASSTLFGRRRRPKAGH